MSPHLKRVVRYVAVALSLLLAFGAYSLSLKLPQLSALWSGEWDGDSEEEEERERTMPDGRPLPGADHPDEAMKFRNLSLMDENGTISSDGLVRAKARVDEMLASSQPAGDSIAGISRSTWTWLGPGNIGGRIRAIAIHPTTPSTMFAGSVGGGIWKTTDSGASWTPVDDFLADLAVSSLIFDPLTPSTMYAGTGEGFYNGDGLRGAGIFKSIDGGTTWTQLLSTNNSSFFYVNRLSISPNASTLLAATRTGIFRSTDGGATWSQRTSTEVMDIDFSLSDSTKAVASGSAGNAFYSVDGGLTWAAASGLPGGSSRRIEIAYAPNVPTIVYASVDVNKGSIYRSTDGGASYTLVSNPTQQYLGSQGWYDNALWVNPIDPNAIIVGGIDLYRSLNGGATISKISYWGAAPRSDHADHHVIVSPPSFNNSTVKTIFSGDDGGVYKTADWSTVGGGGNSDCTSVYPYDCASGWSSLNNNLGVTQFYGGAGHDSSGRILGGTQDNGTLVYNGNAQGWTTEFGGDGGYAAIDPNNNNALYGEYIYLSLHRSLTGSSSGADWINGLYWNGSTYVCKSAPYYIPDVCSSGNILGRANFIAPFILDPNNPNRLLAGGWSLWRTNDAATPNTSSSGPAWASIKGPLATNTPISAIAIAQGNSDVIWVGYNNGDVWKTTNGTAVSPTWTQTDVATPPLPNRMVTRITIDPSNSNTVFVTFGGFSVDNLYRTIDGGFNWANITGSGTTGLPAVPIRDVKVHSVNSAWLYAATDIGVFASADGGATWGPPTTSPTDGPANVAVDELFFMGGTSLVAVTHGRGMFKTPIPSMSVALTADKSAPQPINTTITFTATPTGGVAPVSYKFLLTTTNWASYTVVQDWSTTNTFAWTPTVANANYRVGVWARNAGVSTDAPQAATSMAFPISGPAPVTSVALTADKSAPQPINATITFTATPTGGVAPVSYKFLLTTTNWASYTVVQDWSTTNTFAWTPTVADSNYRIGVWARSAAVSTDAAQAATSMAFPISGPAPVTSVALTADQSAPQVINSTITFTATPTGGVAPVSYKFLLTTTNWASYTVVRDWSTTHTFAWTPTVADSNYRIGVWARSAGASTDAPQAATSIGFSIVGITVSIAADKPAPQPINTAITFTATARGGVAPISYKFLLTTDNFNYTVLQDWSTTNTFAWTPTAPDPNYQIAAWARSADGTSQAGSGMAFPITGPDPVTSVALAADKSAPQAINTGITFTATPTGGVAPVSYKFLLTNNNWASYTVVQNWSTANTFAWTPTAADANYRIGVWTRSAGVSADAPQAATSMAFPITGPAPVTSVALTADKSAPQLINTTITFTATPTGGVAPVSYKFLLTTTNWTSYTVVQDWSTTNTFAWSPTVANANYRIGVWARSAGVSTDTAQAANSMAFPITGPAPVTSVALTADKNAPQVINATITFTATPIGGVAPVSYKFLLTTTNWANYTVVQDWSTTNRFAWTPTVADANYRVGVWARSAGVSTDVPQAATSMAFPITGPEPVTSVALTADKSSPQVINTTITFTAMPTGGVAPVSYKFLLTTTNWASYTVVQDWSMANTFEWRPTISEGNYRIGVWARSAGVTTDAPQAADSMAFVIFLGFCELRLDPRLLETSAEDASLSFARRRQLAALLVRQEVVEPRRRVLPPIGKGDA